MFRAGFIVGVIGDAFLQYSVENEWFGFKKTEGLGLYFSKWDPLASLVAAGLLTGGVSGLYEWFEYDPSAFPFYAVFVDDIYRIYHPYIYPSLSDYYNHYSEFETRTFNTVVALMVLAVEKFRRMIK